MQKIEEKYPSLSTRISDNRRSLEVDEADIETSAAQEVTAENGDNILEVPQNLELIMEFLSML